jgi:signal transduction histidine kinase
MAMNAAAPPRPLPGRTTLVTELTASAVLALAVTVIWAATGRGYFWPMWVYLPIAIVLSAHLGVVWAWSQPEGRHRQLAMHGVVTAILVGIQVAVWAMAGMGFFWPVFSLFALGGAFAIHAVIRWPRQRELEVRVQELTRTRRGALDVQGAELRRIERDLHDGAQARLVALGMSLGMAEQKLADDPERAGELLAEARRGAEHALRELRDLARGIHPPVLADRGLEAALASLASSTPLRVGLSVDVSPRPAPAVESAAYFVAAESLANAAKHARAKRVDITIARHGEIIDLQVRDDGQGGANPEGSGLRGLRRRVEALDGTLSVISPRGGPTTIRAQLPCE